MSTSTTRQPAGTPTGGQFAATARPEGSVTLAPDVQDALTHPMAKHPVVDTRPEGLRTPEAEVHFDAIWSGQANGYSEEILRANLADLTATLNGLRAGTVTPRQVVGTGYKKGRARVVAEEWLTNQIAADEAAIATRGRSHAVNQSNVRYRLRTAAEAGADR